MVFVLYLLSQAVTLYTYALIIYILMSWVPSIQQSSFGQLLGKICDPYLEIFRKVIPPLGMIDISPIVAIFVLQLAMRGMISLTTFL
ncbi:YggT family protein [Psychrobacillus insolitus]|jgi:YggT family protein|uniref:YggT family protein n=1 Tax=Psychrobacillus insolitus TaxID=1461 RepID=A0A2W7MME2_9BACI|nr:YggT family protein [Psychrobacillus insolitus]PZX08035.1 YggT family protein [Psychrobacillus insolitus]